MSGGGGETEYVTQQTSNAPPGFVQDAQKLAVGGATDYFNSDSPQYFPGQTYVDFAPEKTQALDSIRDRALAGSPLQAAGNQTMMNTVNGNMLAAGNPYFSNMLNSAFDPVMDAVNSSAAGLGRMGSGAHAGVMTKELGNIAGNLAFQNYGQERANQMQAAMMAPQYAQADYADMQRLAGVGDVREAKAGEALQDDVNRFNFEQNVDFNKAAQLMSLTSGGQFGMNGTSSQPVFSNPTGNLLGMGATAAGIGNMMGLWGG